MSQLKSQHQKDGNNEAKQHLEEYSKECGKLEKACMNSIAMPENIAALFSERLIMNDACCPNETGGYVDERVLTAVFQADSLIASRSMSKLNDFIYGIDFDYFVLLGSKCLLLWNMKRVNSTQSYQLEMYGCCNIRMKELQLRLNPLPIEWVPASLPLFASPDPFLQTLMALSK